MKILVTGASGFVGRYLSAELSDHGHEVLLTARREYPKAHVCDLRNAEAATRLIQETQPEAVVHLAALPNVHASWDNRTNLIETNVTATANLCAALSTSGRRIRLLFVSSCLVYGAPLKGEVTADEASAPQPTTPYGMSKLAGEYVVRSAACDTLAVTIVRPFNHTGPRQNQGFVCPDFARRVAEAPDQGTIRVGNLTTRRDLTDVRDIVRAYRLILEKQPAPDLFVLGSGRALSMGEILEHFIRLSEKRIMTEIDSKLLRPSDPKKIVADPTLAKKLLGWAPRIPIEQTLREIYAEARRTVTP